MKRRTVGLLILGIILLALAAVGYFMSQSASAPLKYPWLLPAGIIAVVLAAFSRVLELYEQGSRDKADSLRPLQADYRRKLPEIDPNNSPVDPGKLTKRREVWSPEKDDELRRNIDVDRKLGRLSSSK